MVVGAIGRIGSRVGQRAASGGLGQSIRSVISTPLGAGASGFGLGEVTDFVGIDLAGGGDGGGPFSDLFSGPTVIWIFAGIALLAVVADLSGE